MKGTHGSYRELYRNSSPDYGPRVLVKIWYSVPQIGL